MLSNQTKVINFRGLTVLGVLRANINQEMNKYEPVIGLEVHIELSTKSKMFCRCSANYFGAKPNTHTCPICLGLPGAMPKANRVAIEYAQKLGLALNCQVQLSSKFDRKNYFYPDLAKGFQISQYDLPFSENGQIKIELENQTKKISIRRAHLEEDTAKLTHAEVNGKKVTLIDFNRSGVPLLEVVTEPDMLSAEEAKFYAQKLQQITRYLKISDADMEKGSMRIEPNVSLKKVSKVSQSKQVLPSYKVELKNINSFRFAQKAINYEVERQATILKNGQTPLQETRGWNEAKNRTVSQRSKEEAHDYRYFPEPDIPPIRLVETQVKKLKAALPELPMAKFKRFQKDYGLSSYDAEILSRDIDVANYFEEALRAGKVENLTAKQVANIIINKRPDITKILPATLIKSFVAAAQTTSISDEEVEKAVDLAMEGNSKAVADYKKGRQNALMFLVGQVMSKIGAPADANRVKLLLEKKLK